MFKQFFLQFTAVMVLVSITNYYLLLPTVLMSAAFYGLRHIYVKTARCVKRIESMGKSTHWKKKLSTDFYGNFDVRTKSNVRAHKLNGQRIVDHSSLEGTITRCNGIQHTSRCQHKCFLHFLCLVKSASTLAWGGLRHLFGIDDHDILAAWQR